MKRERRRNLRVSVNLRLEMVNVESGVRINANTTDVGKVFGGFNARAASRMADGIYHSPFRFDPRVEVAAEFAWREAARRWDCVFWTHRRKWRVNCANGWDVIRPIASRTTSVRCHLTDLSLHGCYLDIPSPFRFRPGDAFDESRRHRTAVRRGVRVMHRIRGWGGIHADHGGASCVTRKFLGCLTETPTRYPNCWLSRGIGD